MALDGGHRDTTANVVTGVLAMSLLGAVGGLLAGASAQRRESKFLKSLPGRLGPDALKNAGSWSGDLTHLVEATYDWSWLGSSYLRIGCMTNQGGIVHNTLHGEGLPAAELIRVRDKLREAASRFGRYL